MDDGKRGPDGKFESGHRYSLGKGRPATPIDIKEARKANAADVERIINKYLHWKFKALREFVEDENNQAEVLDCLIASIIARAIQTIVIVPISIFALSSAKWIIPSVNCSLDTFDCLFIVVKNPNNPRVSIVFAS